MVYYWILKYILFTVFSKQALPSVYFEGGVQGVLLALPFITIAIII